MNFETVEEAQNWLAARPYSVYTHDGLVVDFRKNHGAGKQRPETLKGSHDELISVVRKAA
jgi:hypothetical protein